MAYIDFHSHILPCFDDGSVSASMSQTMLETLYEQNVETVLLTSHYYSDSIYLKDFVAKREVAYNQLQDVLQSDNVPNTILAAETYLSKYIFNNTDLTPVCINDTRNILLELPFNTRISGRTLDMIYKVMVDYDVTPVLAHIERYGDIISDAYLLDELINMGCYAQVNVSSFTVRQLKKKLLKLVEMGKISALGTDCHNLTSRNPDYITGLKVISDKLGEGYVGRIMQSSYQLIYGE